MKFNKNANNPNTPANFRSIIDSTIQTKIPVAPDNATFVAIYRRILESASANKLFSCTARGFRPANKNNTKIVVKPKIKVPPEQLIDVKALTQLVEKGPEKGAYTLVDSRPGAGFQKGYIPTAISIPFPKMKEMMDKLPKEKDQLVIFYCQGYR